MRTARVSVSFTHADAINTTSNPHVKFINYFQKSSPEERTITQYKVDSGVDTKVYPKKGIKHPYEKVINFVSNFSFGFRVFLFVEHKIATVGPTAQKEHRPDMIMRKFRNLFWNNGLINHGKKKNFPIWYLRLAENQRRICPPLQ